MTTLYQHQEKFLTENPNKKLLCWDTGSGKTLAAIGWANEGRSEFLLVVCPKALKENWQRNLLRHCKVPNWRVLTKEGFRKEAATLGNYQQIIVDEAHHFAGRTSQMTHSLTHYLKGHKIERVLLLTATPYRSSPWDVFTLAKHLGFYINWAEFENRFFEMKYVGYNKKVPAARANMEEELASVVSQFADVVRLEECVDVPEQTFETELFELTNEQTIAKKQVYDANPIVRYTKHHEIENGFLKGDEYKQDAYYYSTKEDRIINLCDQHDKIIIVCRYHGQLALLNTELVALKKTVFHINGSVQNRDEVCQQAEAAKKAIVLVQAACSEGYELPSFPVMVFASLDFSYVNYKQMCGRILRINKLKKNVYLHLVSNGVDVAVYNAIMKKRDFDSAIYEREDSDETNSADALFGERLPDLIQPMA